MQEETTQKTIALAIKTYGKYNFRRYSTAL